MISVQSFTSVINQLLPEPHAGLLNGILFGTKATISKDLYQALITTGTLHIIALSGMNITILTSLVNLALLRVVSRRIASLLTIAVIAGFVWFVGSSASVIRAAIMGTISLLAIIFGRQYWALLSWMLAVGMMLLLNFSWLGDLSFQLSVLATLGIILFGRHTSAGSTFFGDVRQSIPPLRSSQQSSLSEVPLPTESKTSLSNLGRDFSAPQNGFPHSLISVLYFIWRFIEDDLRLTLAAQVFTIPLILWQFHRISLISPLSNILIGWIIQPLTVLGLVTAVAGFVFLPLGQLVGWVTWVPLTYLLIVVEWTSKIPFASVGR